MKNLNSLSDRFRELFLLLFGIVLITAAGCQKENSIQTAAQDVLATDDAAAGIAGAVSLDNGGVLDQVQDILNTPTQTGMTLKTTAFDMEEGSSPNMVSTYDSLTGWWTVSISRTRSGPKWTSQFDRVYKHQFLNKNGVFQKQYITNGDTAYTVEHETVSGSGLVTNMWSTHQLKSLTAKWTATGTNTSFVTINSVEPYTRSAIDTIKRAAGTRTLDETVTINFVNVVGPRGSGLDWHKKLSGTVTGHYHALVSFQKAESYTEKTIDRDFTITFGDTMKVNVGGKTYTPDPETGQIQ